MQQSKHQIVDVSEGLIKPYQNNHVSDTFLSITQEHPTMFRW